MSEVIDNQAEQRFELAADGWLAMLVYRLRGQRIVLVHTEVPEELGGRGLGARLVQAALDRARAEDLTVVPLCPYARAWLEKHPEAAEGLTIDWESGTGGGGPATT